MDGSRMEKHHSQGVDATAILAGMKAICEAATKGPWAVIVEECDEYGCGRGEIFVDEIERSFHSCEWADPKDWERDEANADFCAAARTGWPATIRALKVAREALDRIVAETRTEADFITAGRAKMKIDAILEGRDA